MSSLEKELIEKYKFSESDLEITRSYFSLEIVEKKEFFLEEGRSGGKLGFVKSGLLRSYFIDESGRDITTQFFLPGNVVIQPESFNKNLPALENVTACEKSELLTVTKEKFEELCKKVPQWSLISRDVADIKSNKFHRQMIKFQTESAQERYNNFCKENPEIISKVPLGHIASYLGMDIATLSRLRSRK